MNPQGEYTSYDLLAIKAGRAAGLKLPTVAAAAKLTATARKAIVAKVADSKKAVKIRDKMFVDFERRLLDANGYTGDHIVKWFRKEIGPIGRSGIYRARAALQAAGSRIAEISAQAQAFMSQVSESGPDAVFDAATQRAGQLYFQLLMELDAEDLSGLKAEPAKIITLIDSLGSLQRSRAQTKLLDQKVVAMTRSFDAEMKRIQRKTKGKSGALTPAMIQQVREAVFGSAA